VTHSDCLKNTHLLTPIAERIRAKNLAVLVALGDSNTCNASFTGGFKQWPELLHSELRIGLVSQRVLLVNAGICGDTAEIGNQRLDSDVLRFAPSLVFVSFGSNDGGRYTPGAFRGHMERLIDRIQEAGALVAIRTSPPVMELEPSPPHIWRDDDAHWRLMDVNRELADLRGLPLIDHHLWWRRLEEAGELGIGTLMHDCVHPNAKGHQLLARQVCAAFALPDQLHFERGAGEAQGA
jgi:lysophospholipase L1-like esterase